MSTLPTPPSTFSDELWNALRDWHAPSPESHPWQKLALFTPVASLRSDLNRILLTGLDALTQADAQAARVLRLRFADELTAQQTANRLHVVEGTIYKWQREAIEKLAESLWRLERDSRTEHQQRLRERLPTATYTQLFGIDCHLASLRFLLLAPNPPWLVAVESLGGLGKTALVDALCRSLISDGQIQALAWVTAHPQHFAVDGVLQSAERPALTSTELVQALSRQLLDADPDFPTLSTTQKEERLVQRFRALPHLVVVDNLETMADVNAILGHLRRWANPTRFLLTTRHSLLSEADIYHFSLPELSQPAALDFLRYEAQLRNLPSLASAPEADLVPIYECVGGNPLALRLVVGQLHAYPLPAVLTNLRKAQGSAIAGLYTHIYQQVWHSLDEEARRILLAMPLVSPDGGDLELLSSISGLPSNQLVDGLAQLIHRNLVDARGGLHQRRYSIHSLTRTFLHEQVLHWGG